MRMGGRQGSKLQSTLYCKQPVQSTPVMRLTLCCRPPPRPRLAGAPPRSAAARRGGRRAPTCCRWCGPERTRRAWMRVGWRGAISRLHCHEPPAARGRLTIRFQPSARTTTALPAHLARMMVPKAPIWLTTSSRPSSYLEATMSVGTPATSIDRALTATGKPGGCCGCATAAVAIACVRVCLGDGWRGWEHRLPVGCCWGLIGAAAAAAAPAPARGPSVWALLCFAAVDVLHQWTTNEPDWFQ